jgi:hypothetical protein
LKRQGTRGKVITITKCKIKKVYGRWAKNKKDVLKGKLSKQSGRYMNVGKEEIDLKLCV